ncbi:MAG: putative metal-binding motif-containing protein, partial [Candidatus Gracilibacteria bacterium]
MSPRKPQSESDGLLSRLASKATVPQAAGLAFIASMANADVRSEVMNTLMPQAHAAEDWQDQGTENNANADGEYIWCFGGDPNGVHVRQIWDFGSGVSTTQIHDGTETGTHVDGLDAAIAAYDPSINTQEICVQDVDPALDQIKFQNFGEGLGFIVNGYVNTGAISRIAYLDGSEVYTGNLHNGRAFAPSWNGGDIGAFEQFEGADPTEYYVHPTDDLVTLVVNPDTRQVFAAKDFLTGQVYKYDNAYPGSASVTESTLTGVTGEPRSWKDADASSDYNRFATLTDGETHIVLDMDSGTVVDPDADLDGYTVTAGGDCNDADAAINPGAAEMCDSVDNNCDGSTDGSDAADATTWYRDHDRDGVGGAVTEVACEQPDGCVPVGGDYDDNDPLVQNPPGACEDGEESADGSFEVGEVICAPMGSATVYGG